MLLKKAAKTEKTPHTVYSRFSLASFRLSSNSDGAAGSCVVQPQLKTRIKTGGGDSRRQCFVLLFSDSSDV